MATPFAICNLHDPPQPLGACPCPLGDAGSTYYRPKFVAALAEIARLRALAIEACDELTGAAKGLESRSDAAARRAWAKDAYATAERIRKELTRG